ncbi:MAG: DUF1566 domain-containing protein [Deltaproteobacteria bacterium]|nr:DUF1566 domain-containing protein [Deltaproteobacteria bacterium]
MTGLMWQRAILERCVDWVDAEAYCDSLDLASYADWRLPSVKELISIFDATRGACAYSQPSIDASAFAGSAHYPATEFWSSTLSVSGPVPWNVSFEVHRVSSDIPSYGGLVRCVRTGL